MTHYDSRLQAWADYNVTVRARIAGGVGYPCNRVTTLNQSRIVKGVAGWQTGPTGVTPDQPAGNDCFVI